MKAGIFIAIFLVAFIAAPLASLFNASDLLSDQQSSIKELWFSTYFRRVVFFSLLQAFLSTLLSVVIGFP